MAMKQKITKAEYDKLSDALKGEYLADGDNFKLDLSDAEDTGPLKRALEREKADAGTSKARVKELEQQLSDLADGDARKVKDIGTLEKSWEAKMTKQREEFEGKLSNRDKFIKEQLVDSVASTIAHKISKSPALLLPHIKARLAADLDGDVPATKVLDASGKLSAMTVDELSAEFVANKDFSAIILASQASGGAGASNKGGGATNQGNGNNPPADLSKISPKQLAEQIKESKLNQQ